MMQISFAKFGGPKRRTILDVRPYRGRGAGCVSIRLEEVGSIKLRRKQATDLAEALDEAVRWLEKSEGARDVRR